MIPGERLIYPPSLVDIEVHGGELARPILEGPFVATQGIAIVADLHQDRGEAAIAPPGLGQLPSAERQQMANYCAATAK